METHRWRFYFDFSEIYLKSVRIRLITSASPSVLRSVSAALSRFKVCRLWGPAWLLWVSTTPQKLWWYSLDCMLLCSIRVRACPCVLCTNLRDVFWLPLSRSWSRRRASSHSGRLRGRSPAVLSQLSFPCGETWQRWTWATTASAPSTDPWWDTPTKTKHSVNIIP